MDKKKTYSEIECVCVCVCVREREREKDICMIICEGADFYLSEMTVITYIVGCRGASKLGGLLLGILLLPFNQK